MYIISFLFVGLVVGWVATTIKEGHGLGIFRDILVGVAGAFVGGFVLNFLGFREFGFLGSIVTSILGAIVLLYVIGLFTNHSKRTPLTKS